MKDIKIYPIGGIIDEVEGGEDPVTLPDPTKIKIKDSANIKSGDYSKEHITGLIKAAKAAGVDPYALISLSLQESGIGTAKVHGRAARNTGAKKAAGNFLGQVNDFEPAQQKELDMLTQKHGIDASYLKPAIVLRDKLKYAKQLGFKDEALALQAYNGYGKLKRKVDNQGITQPTKYYGIDVPEEGLDMRKNPLYGKRLLSLKKDLMSNKDISGLVSTLEKGGRIKYPDGTEDPIGGVPVKASNTFQTQAELDAANALAKGISTRRGLIPGEDAYVGRKVGDTKPIWTIDPSLQNQQLKPKLFNLPNYVQRSDISTADGQAWYTDPQTGDVVDIDMSVLNQKRFKLPDEQLVADKALRDKQLAAQNSVVKTFEYGGKPPRKKFVDGTEDPITGITPQVNPGAKNAGIDVFGNANNYEVPINPNAPQNQQIFALNPQKGSPNQQSAIVPLEQFYDQYTDQFGNKQLTGTGQYVNEQGQVNTQAQQQTYNDQISKDNLAESNRRDENRSEAEKYAALGITAINSYFNKKNASQQERKNRRAAIMQEVAAAEINPYMEGTGSQAIFEQGGEIHIKPENRGKFTAAAKKAGMGVQAYAAKILGNKEDYSSTLVKRANFARNAAKWHEDGGEIPGENAGVQVVDGGKSKLISGSNHSNPMVEFVGKEHSEGGIGVAYGGKISEVENKEIGWIDNEGGLNIFGKLKLPGTNQTFRKTAKDIGKQEDKIDGQLTKYVNVLNNGDPTDKYQETAHSTAKVMVKSLDKRAKDIAEKKEALASYQNLILSMTNPNQPDQMKYGGKMPKKPKKYAEGGEVEEGGPDDPIVVLPLKSDFEKNGRDLSKVKSVILHKTAGENGAKSIVAGWDSDKRQASADYIIDKDGTIHQVGDLKDTKWGSGRKDVNRTALNIEIVGSSPDESDMTPAQYQALARLNKDVFQPMGISPNDFYGHTQVNKKKGFDFAKPESIKNVLTKAGISTSYTPNTTYDQYNDMDENTGKADLTNTTVAQTTSGKTPVNALAYTPTYIPIDNGGGQKGTVVSTPYGPAKRDPTPFSDKTNIGNGGRTRDYISPLAIEQIAPELLTMATNERQIVEQQTYQPELLQTFDVSYQLGRNQNQSSFNQVAKIAEQSGNVDALAELAAQKYKADETYNVQEIQGNAQQKLATYAQNTATLNDAKVKNIALIADQQVKQASADFNTRKEDISAFTSISGKVLQNRLENKTYNAYANLFKHYGFDKKGNVTFQPDDIAQKFTAGEAQQFGMMAAQQGAAAIMNGNFSRQFTKVKNADGSQTTTETLGNNKKIQEKYKALKAQGFDDGIIGNMLRAEYPETINQD